MRCTKQMNKHKHCIYQYSSNASSRSFSANTIKPTENAAKWVLLYQITTVNVKHHWHHIDIGRPKSLSFLCDKPTTISRISMLSHTSAISILVTEVYRYLAKSGQSVKKFIGTKEKCIKNQQLLGSPNLRI